ncbi:glycosyltransferase family 2 protein [Paenibacillus endoradicis]|uniref:glycosyltransferase family 2 protein n=1 Tax=Paenibacillus endoradicis TaxID=2972487 RepID=UPI002158FC99|nr:glycosyltransferase [Paenibacillus endoradicis]MCR8659883.1 glycosyltransferase [Paenibacillus endoradicis]
MANLTSDQLLKSCENIYEDMLQLLESIERSEVYSGLVTALYNNHQVLQTIETEASNYTRPHRVPQLTANIYYYEEQLQLYIQQEDKQSIYYHLRYHYCNLIRLLCYEIAYIVEQDVDIKHYPKLYPDLTAINHQYIIEQGKQAKYEVSVVLLAYNNLQFTSQCIESIIQNMDGINYELIVVDNGSTDGTKTYFESLSNAKVIHLNSNIHLVKGFNIGMMAAEGKYIAAVCNDFIFTPNWLSNLLICLKSDESIGFVSPGATYISNYQSINIPFHSIEDFQQRAREYNVSDTSKWEERVVLLPNVLCCPTALLDAIGYYDTRYYRGEFLDDDISFRIRRAGYKLIYCGDTVTHHYGSLTTASDHATNSLQEGRKIFNDRYNIDAWLDARKNQACQFIDYSGFTNVTTILGIDVRCGSSLIDLKNKIWANHGVKTEVLTCTSETKYITDLQSISKRVFHIEQLTQLPHELKHSVDLIYIEQGIDQYEGNIDEIFQSLTELLRPNGQVIFCCHNRLSVEMMKETYVQSQRQSNFCRFSIPEINWIANKHRLELTFQKDFVPLADEKRSQAIIALTQFIAGINYNYAIHLESQMNSHYSLLQMSYRTEEMI